MQKQNFSTLESYILPYINIIFQKPDFFFSKHTVGLTFDKNQCNSPY